jgi:hypothetical protein
MNETLSTRQLRLVALLGLVVVLAGGYWAVTRHKSSTTTTSKSTPAHTTVTPTTPSKSHTHTATPTKLATHGLPAPVARALRKHSIVVVSLSSPGSDLDKISKSEAKAGAAASGVGFVAIDVFHQGAGIPLLHKLGVVDTPAVLVIKRPANILHELRGFVDRDVVAQAVTDAR